MLFIRPSVACRCIVYRYTELRTYNTVVVPSVSLKRFLKRNYKVRSRNGTCTNETEWKKICTYIYIYYTINVFLLLPRNQPPAQTQIYFSSVTTSNNTIEPTAVTFRLFSSNHVPLHLIPSGRKTRTRAEIINALWLWHFGNTGVRPQRFAT